MEKNYDLFTYVETYGMFYLQFTLSSRAMVSSTAFTNEVYTNK